MKKYIRGFAVTALIMTCLSFLLLVISVLFQRYVFAAYSALFDTGTSEMILKYWDFDRWIVSWPSIVVCLIQIICLVILLSRTKCNKGGIGGEIAVLVVLILVVPVVASLEANLGFLAYTKYWQKILENSSYYNIYYLYVYYSHDLGNHIGNWVNDVPRICMIPAMVAQLVGCVACSISLVARKTKKDTVSSVE